MRLVKVFTCASESCTRFTGIKSCNSYEKPGVLGPSSFYKLQCSRSKDDQDFKRQARSFS
jgi:hypothetical protein